MKTYAVTITEKLETAIEIEAAIGTETHRHTMKRLKLGYCGYKASVPRWLTKH